MRFPSIIFSAVFFLLFNAVNGQQKIKPEKLQEDYQFLLQELRLQHQGLYEYIDEKQTDELLDSIGATLNSPMTQLEFFEKLWHVLALTNEGHTSMELPKKAMVKIGLSQSFLPFTVRVMDENLILTQHFGKENEDLKNGLRITSINGKPTQEILSELYPLMPTDGFNETAKREWIGGTNFSLLYRLHFGKTRQFDLVLEEYGQAQPIRLQIPAVRFTRFKRKNAQLQSIPMEYNRFKFEQINDSIAYLSIPSFGEDDLDYETFYRNSFRKMDSLQIQHLILDIQANGGGTEGNENLLFSYLSEEVIRKYKQVTMLKKPYLINEADPYYREDKWAFSDSIASRGDFTLYSNYYSDLGYQKPDYEDIFQGKLTVLTSGKTFSGGAEFASMIRMTDRGIFIGEEVGGAYEGNVSGYSEFIRLPHSKIEVEIPTVHFQLDVNPKQKGRGVIPEYIVPQTWEDYLKAENSKKKFAIRKIMNQL
ncbi:S41 family peptidase [Algoriphagus sp. PAP.12]|uniref:S41 family peptidase n=1 Tax=Algoriphagus sp. PAP.12 TaxID=2996678 RepID=UPI00227C41B2|nr:S41 family peptidase [Algoriphagus sp. PAP.12]